MGETPRARKTRKNLLINLSLLVGAVLVYFLVLELVLQASAPAGSERDGVPEDYAGVYRRALDPALGYELAPGKNGLVNSAGFIGPEVDTAKPPGIKRLVGLGDSITMYQSAEGTNYLQVAERELADAQVLNFGVGGYDTAQEVRTLELKGLAYAPDVVVLGYCLNDGFDDYFIFNEVTRKLSLVEGRSAEIPEVAEIANASGDGEERGLAITRFIERKVKAASADLDEDAFYEMVFASQAWTASLAALEALQALSKAHGFRVVVLIFPFLLDSEPYFFARLHARLAEVSRGLGFGVVDLYEPFVRGSAGDLKTLRVHRLDHIHPGAKGHALAAEALVAWLVEEAGWSRAEAP